MSFKDLLVFVDALPGGDERLDLAVALARQHEAHLTAVHVVRPPRAAGAGAIMPAELAILSGRPVIVAPDAGVRPTVGENLLIAWKPTREAVRAIAEAMPLLRRAERVTLLSVNPHVGAPEHGEQPGADLARHLARHGVEIVVETAVAHDVGVADAVLSRAAQVGADLIVMGAGGHSRLHEMIFGGATVDMLEQAALSAPARPSAGGPRRRAAR